MKNLLFLIFIFLCLVFSFNQLQAIDVFVEIDEVNSVITSEVVLNNDENISLGLKPNITEVSALATISNDNGHEAIGEVSAVIYRTSKTNACSVDFNNCYKIESCEKNNCSGLTCDYTCSADFKYYADSTDEYSSWNEDNWSATIKVTDSGGTDEKTSQPVNLITNIAYSVIESTIAYGSLELGKDTGDFNPTTEIINIGNAPITIKVSGTNMTAAETEDIIPVSNQEYSLANFIYGTGNDLSLEESTITNINKPTSDNIESAMIFWGIKIPLEIEGGIYSGTINFNISLGN